MLKLYSIRKEDVVYTFLGGRKYAVARKNGDVTLPDDQSISRHHADIEVDHPRANIDNPALQPTLMVTDVGSKFGTFINEQIDASPGIPINMREPVNLEGGSRVRFGRQWSEFKFEYTPLVITCSTLRDTVQLKELICQLGGHLVPEWTSECRYVVMDSVTLTIKAVCALLAGGYIVSPNYFKDMVASILASNSANLDPMAYTPPLGEAGLSSTNVNLKPVPARSRLFRGKIFLFCNNKQMKKLGILVKTGGGNTKLVVDCPASELGSADILMMSPPVDISLLDKNTVKVIDMYKASGKRLIQESEISLAAVHVTIGKQCNPYFDYAQRIFPPMPSQTQRSPGRGSVIIPETQSSAETQRSEGPYSRTVIEESCNMTDDNNGSGQSVLSGTQIKSEKNPGTGDGKRGRENVDTSSSKRRLELESETPGASAFQSEPETKRQKSSVLGSQMKSKTLNALFNMSDSDDDDDNSILPSTSGQQADPMSQSQRKVTRGTSGVPAVEFDFVGIPQKNLRSPNKAGPSSNRAAAAKANSESRGAPFVDFVPGSSDEDDDDNKEGPIPNHNNVSMLPTAALPTMALPTMPLPTAQMPTLALSLSNRKGRRTTAQETRDETESSSSSRSKRRADSEVVINDVKPEAKKTKLHDIFGKKTSSASTDIDKKLDKMTIGAELKKKHVDIIEFLKPAPVQFGSLMREDRPPFPPLTATSGSSSGPNFKRFKKVWPLTPYNLSDVKEAEETLKNSAPVPCASVRITYPTEKPSKKQQKQMKATEEKMDEENEDCFAIPTRTQVSKSRTRNPASKPPVVVLSSKKKPAHQNIVDYFVSPKKSTTKRRSLSRNVSPPKIKIDSPPVINIDEDDDEGDNESGGLFDF